MVPRASTSGFGAKLRGLEAREQSARASVCSRLHQFSNSTELQRRSAPSTPQSGAVELREQLEPQQYVAFGRYKIPRLSFTMLSETEEWDEAPFDPYRGVARPRFRSLCLVPQRDSGHLESRLDPAADAVVQIDAWDFEPPLAVGFSIRAVTLVSQ
jgi:hypothetical protein